MIRRLVALLGICALIAILIALLWTVHSHRNAIGFFQASGATHRV